ncbi:nuclease-related domain-containing protein [Arthrobacter sp. Soil736]|uniref:nuclease-related domain-containing protein n=1 Tax=Arthrobacter sp. Soil736 TaxID=1736395 RepID=UPI000AD2FD56|nr:nuclease-related domain-containing protein [Arthrobacter sp. Soil736]
MPLDNPTYISAVLHDRRIPGSKANIDHIAITPGGIWVIDAKRYKGRPELKIEGGILRPRVEKLLVGRRDCTKLVDGVLKQVDVVRDLVGDVPVTGALCFIEADWPLIGGAFSTHGVHVLWPKRLAKVLIEQTAGDVDVAAMREAVASRFKSA